MISPPYAWMKLEKETDFRILKQKTENNMKIDKITKITLISRKASFKIKRL